MAKPFERKPAENAVDTSRTLADLQKTAALLDGHLGSVLGHRLLGKYGAFRFFSHLFNLQEWTGASQLRGDRGVDPGEGWPELAQHLLTHMLLNIHGPIAPRMTDQRLFSSGTIASR